MTSAAGGAFWRFAGGALGMGTSADMAIGSENAAEVDGRHAGGQRRTKSPTGRGFNSRVFGVRVCDGFGM